jgi:hypothetical protein
MTEQPDRIEDLLREAMRAHTAGAHPAPGLASKALRGAARGRRVQYAATAAASVAAVGAVTATGLVVQSSSHRGTSPSLGVVPSPSGTCFDTASPIAASASASSKAAASTAVALASRAPTFAGSSLPPASPGVGLDHPSMSTGPSQAIQAVTLADPAPGYPVRRGSDSVTPTGFGPSSDYWTATFLLAQRPGVSHTIEPGVVETDPTGPEATVLVIDGHPFDLDNPKTVEGVPVTGTTSVLGHEAWVTNACDQTDIFFSTGQFQVLLAAFPGGDDDAQETNIARLTAVAEQLRGLQ